MADGLAFIRRGGALIPADAEAHDALSKIKEGASTLWEKTASRNVEQMRLYWTVCACVAENHEELTSRDAVSDAIKIIAGHFETCAVQVGASKMFLMRPKSISFAKMSDNDFQAYLDRSLNIIAQHLLPGCDLSSY